MNFSFTLTALQEMDSQQPLKDTDILDWGKEHKGKALANVPASYLIWMYEKATGVPLKYRLCIKDNLDVLQMEVRQGQKRPYQRSKL